MREAISGNHSILLLSVSRILLLSISECGAENNIYINNGDKGQDACCLAHVMTFIDWVVAFIFLFTVKNNTDMDRRYGLLYLTLGLFVTKSVLFIDRQSKSQYILKACATIENWLNELPAPTGGSLIKVLPQCCQPDIESNDDEKANDDEKEEERVTAVERVETLFGAVETVVFGLR
jgi:hypothetical protein